MFVKLIILVKRKRHYIKVKKTIIASDTFIELKLIMDLEQFKQSLSQDRPPSQVSDHLKALWHDARGNWEQSHNIIQDIDDNNATWIHAYLHRKEGDIWNADYWYSKAGKKRPSVSLQQEWENIVAAIIGY